MMMTEEKSQCLVESERISKIISTLGWVLARGASFELDPSHAAGVTVVRGFRGAKARVV